MPLLTCKQFLDELNALLDDSVDPQLREELKKHVSECPNCWVVCDTTERTIKVFKGMEAQPLPQSVQTRLTAFLERNCKGKKRLTGEGPCGDSAPTSH